MADIAGAAEEDEAARLRREREEAMERMLLQGEQDHQAADNNNGQDDGGGVGGGNAEMMQQGNNNNDNLMQQGRGQDQQQNEENDFNPLPQGFGSTAANNNNNKGLSYTTTSFCLAFVTLWYALRTREQWYLALVYLGSSKVAYCVLGNALVAFAVVTFDVTTKLFLGGLRVLEAEGLQDFFRWNVTETCLALTMFRSELTITVAIQFLALVLVKCLHHVTVLREQHLRMTDDAVRGASWNANVPVVPWHHVKVLLMLVVLQSLDLVAVQYTAEDLLNTGPSVSILFAFEAAILLVSAWSAILLWYIHVTDGLLHFWHDQHFRIGQVLIHPWKEYKATLTFAVELQAQAVQFLFYLAFFGFVMTYYGMPINLFREVYVSFMALKERLWAFLKYRRLMASMNRFATPTEEQLEEAGRICIICRDEMTLHDCKALPVCQHMFHKSCLREWLTQQQSCPTCRSDIASMEARQAAAAAANQRQQPEEEPAAAPPDQQQPQPTEESNSAEDTTTPAVEEQAGSPEPERANLSRGVPAPAQAPETPAPSLPPQETKTPAHSHKKVRFSVEKRDPTLVFPALYRVVRERGADVWNVDNYPPSVIRRLSFGAVVFGKDIQGIEMKGEMSDFVEIPDGWVSDDAVVRVFDQWNHRGTMKR